jgi:D-alanine-D-alanine ligase
MRIAFLYNRADDDPAQFAEDDDPQKSPVVAALRRLGHDVTPIACTLDLEAARRQIKGAAPDVAFNRVESLGRSDAMAVAVAMLLDALHIPYTGGHTESLVATASKISVKRHLVRAGLPTPEWISDEGKLKFPNPQSASSSPATAGNPKFILKSIYEHASFEMDDTAVIGPAPAMEISDLVRKRSAHSGKPFFAERFIEGREFNLSLLGNPPEVLPPAEIDFSAFPTTKPRIVGFGAKWAESSFEFQNTPRTFDFPPADAALLHGLTNLAIECWRLFDLRGYARVDFRVDTAGQPWILEINTNPCIAPTSGFAAAVAQAGFTYEEGIARIVEAALPPALVDRSHGTEATSHQVECGVQ